MLMLIYSLTDKLYVNKIDENAQYLPSPEQLKHRLIIKVSHILTYYLYIINYYMNCIIHWNYIILISYIIHISEGKCWL